MLKVYFESDSHADLMAVFANEDVFQACLPALEKMAKENNMKVTESVEADDIENKDLRQCPQCNSKEIYLTDVDPPSCVFGEPKESDFGIDRGVQFMISCNSCGNKYSTEGYAE